MKESLILIGMPASGKSTVGVILAKVLGLRFIDTDLCIQERTGRRLPEILEAEGIEGFLCREEEALLSLAGAAGQGAVIATGGSAVYSTRGMEALRQLGPVLWLRVGFPELSLRLRDMQSRGVVLRPGQTLEELYLERQALYGKWADGEVIEDGRSLEQVVSACAQWTEGWKAL